MQFNPILNVEDENILIQTVQIHLFDYAFNCFVQDLFVLYNLMFHKFVIALKNILFAEDSPYLAEIRISC